MIEAAILFALVLMLLLGKAFGELFHKLGFSPLIGQMVAGIALGPMCLNVVTLTGDFELLFNISVLFMMFLMGLAVDFEKVMSENVYKASFMSLIGGCLTFFSASTITALLGFDINVALLVGISFISTSTAIGFMVLTKLGDNYSRVFKSIVAVGITDDIFAMLALSLFLSYLSTGVDLESAFKLFLLVLGFIIFVLSFGRSITERLIKYSRKSTDEQSIISYSLIILFFVAFLSDSIGVASVTGAFLAGTLLARSQFSYKVITPKIEAVSEGFFVPIFFVYTGARINILEILSSENIDLMIAAIPIDVVLFLGLLMAVLASKLIGTYISASMIGEYKDEEIKKMGLAMTPMGEYTLVIGQLGLVIGILTTQIYSVLALIVLATSIFTPIMLRKAYDR
ncbi:cation:proton antiporter [Methanocella sp. CWC-04]|uniref:Cation:proton antiporter n=1 Tax=Methanooceanicella nereidis TaxID=2052831 RepID=A0AAP2W671_9EURY|nr:cation:proton antiporter [Methanocella sp. CWC-04]MCD1294972.1 cation:proton antiporter [Methanocella sp. CWC-04]